MIFNNWNPTTQDPSFSQNMQKKKVTIKTSTIYYSLNLLWLL